MGNFLYKFGVNEVAKRGLQKTGYVWKKRGGQEKLKLKIYQKNSNRKFMNIFFFFLAHSTALPTDHWADVSTLAV